MHRIKEIIKMISNEQRIGFFKKMSLASKDEDKKGFLKYIGSFSQHNEKEIIAFFNNHLNQDLITLSLERFIYVYFNGILKHDYSSFVFGSATSFSPGEMFEILKYSFVFKIYNTGFILWRDDELKNSAKYDREFQKENNFVFYRGQASIEWLMAPSVIRGLNQNIILDDNGYYHLLKATGLLEKYEIVFKDTNVKGAYKRYAFLQHACSYSPLIDLTSNHVVATSFALSNPNSFNDFYNCDSVVFTIEARSNVPDKGMVIESIEEANTFLKTRMKIKVLNESYVCFGKSYTLKRYDSLGQENNETITFNTFDEMLKQLKPSFMFIKCPTNDRMIYQRGLFLVLYDCVALKTKILYDLNPKFIFYKTRISCNHKRTLLEQIKRDYNHFTYHHLMSPYSYFNE